MVENFSYLTMLRANSADTTVGVTPLPINQSINQFHSAHIGDINVNGNQFLPTKIGCLQAKPEKETPLNETQVRYGEVLRQ